MTNEPAGEAISALGTNAQPGHALYYGTVEGGLFRVDEALTAPAGTTGVELTGNAAFSAGSWVTGIAVHPADDRKVLICRPTTRWPVCGTPMTGAPPGPMLKATWPGPTGRRFAVWPSILWTKETCGGPEPALVCTPPCGRRPVPVWVQESPDDIGNVIVEALTIRPADGLIAVATFGRGIFTTNYSPASPVNLPEAVGRLAQNVPNPFNPSTEIFFHLSEPGMVQLEVFDIRGQRVKTLVNEYLVDGDHRAIWDGRDQAGQQMASGTYLYRLQSGAWVEQKKMILLK